METKFPVETSWHPFGLLPEWKQNPTGLFDRLAQKGPMVGFRLLHLQAVLTRDPQAAHELLVSKQESFSKNTLGYRVLRDLLGEGLVTAQGDVWKRHRRIANPAFHRKTLKGFVETMARATEEALAHWQGPIELGEAFSALTLRIAGETLFGVDLSGDTGEISLAVRTALGSFQQRVTRASPLLNRLPTKENRAFDRSVADLDRVVHRLILERRAQGESRNDLLGMLMDTRDELSVAGGGDPSLGAKGSSGPGFSEVGLSGLGLSDKELRDEAVTMLLAGHETTATALTWTMHLLGRHPEVLAELRAEVDQQLGTELPSFESLSKLVAMKRTVNEALRLYPPIWLLVRRAEKGVELSGRSIREGTFVFLSLRNLHRSPEVWDQAELFKPERFLNPPAHPSAFIPFSNGPRKCIGDRFAEAELLTILSILLQRSNPQIEGGEVGLAASVTLRPDRPIRCEFRPR
jgi:cytochrome P450